MTEVQELNLRELRPALRAERAVAEAESALESGNLFEAQVQAGLAQAWASLSVADRLSTMQGVGLADVVFRAARQ